LGHRAVVDPAVAVRDDLVPGLHAGARDLGVALERHHDREQADRHPALLDDLEQAPDAAPAAELVARLDEDAALAGVRREGRVRERSLGGGVAVENAHLAARLVVDRQQHRDAGAARPLRVGQRPAVADHVAGVRVRRHSLASFVQVLSATSGRRDSRSGRPSPTTYVPPTVTLTPASASTTFGCRTTTIPGEILPRPPTRIAGRSSSPAPTPWPRLWLVPIAAPPA